MNKLNETIAIVTESLSNPYPIVKRGTNTYTFTPDKGETYLIAMRKMFGKN